LSWDFQEEADQAEGDNMDEDQENYQEEEDFQEKGSQEEEEDESAKGGGSETPEPAPFESEQRELEEMNIGNSQLVSLHSPDIPQRRRPDDAEGRYRRSDLEVPDEETENSERGGEPAQHTPGSLPGCGRWEISIDPSWLPDRENQEAEHQKALEAIKEMGVDSGGRKNASQYGSDLLYETLGSLSEFHRGRYAGRSGRLVPTAEEVEELKKEITELRDLLIIMIHLLGLAPAGYLAAPDIGR
jgi:hypothetical protein